MTRDRQQTVTATEAKNDFGRILETALQGRTVIITRHNSPKAVLISVERFQDLEQSGRNQLDTLSAEFDLMLAQMQTAKARTAMKRAFHASPKQLGKAAVTAARKRG